jgi:GNAT superfamily N-acetyltransferase
LVTYDLARSRMIFGPAIRLRPAAPDDRDFFFSTRRAAFEQYVDELSGWDEGRERAAADREFDELPVEIIEERGAPIGYLCLVSEPDHEWLDEIALVPEAQRRGVGTWLVQRILRGAAERRIPVRLSVLVNNPGRGLYERLGFTVTSTEHPRVKMEWRPRP